MRNKQFLYDIILKLRLPILCGFIFILMVSVSSAQEKSCTDLLEEAVKQIKEKHPNDLFSDDFEKWNGETQRTTEKTPHGNKEGVKVGKTFIYCANGVSGAAGETYPKGDGNSQVMVDEDDADKDLGLVKSVVYHELIHAGLMSDGFGYTDPETGARVGPEYANGKKKPGGKKDRWNKNIQPCHEAIAYANTLVFMQKIGKEFPGLTNSDQFWRWIDSFESNADKCMKAKFKGKWEGVGKKLKAELEKLKEKIIEKKLLKANKDGVVSRGDLILIHRIRDWLGMSLDEFEKIYKETVLTSLPINTLQELDIPRNLVSLIENERILFVIESENIREKVLVTKGAEVGDGRFSLREQVEPTMTITIDEVVLNSLSNSLDPVFAVQTAIKDGEIKIEKGILTPFINLGQRILGEVSASKETLISNEGEGEVKTNAKGVTFLEFEGRNDVVMLNKYNAPVGHSTKSIQNLLNYKPEQLSKNAGIYAENIDQLRIGEI